MEKVKGYKVFLPDWTCRDYQYEVGKTYHHEGSIGLCSSGFHFCERLVDCFNYYSFNPENKVAEVVATGEVIKGDDKSVTNNIEIVRELSWNDVLNLVNTGKGNTGFCNSGNRNSGNRNSGDWNSGDWNSGNRNSGDWNSGDCNSGNRNSGNRNSGDCNSGNWNSGDCNSGNRNSGDWNSGSFNACNYSTGMFNTKEQPLYLFNKPTDFTWGEFKNIFPNEYNLLFYSTFPLSEWVNENNMSDKEKEENPEYKTTGGYLKKRTYHEAWQIMWGSWTKEQQDSIKKLPNFDKDIFKEITGIEV